MTRGCGRSSRRSISSSGGCSGLANASRPIVVSNSCGSAHGTSFDVHRCVHAIAVKTHIPFCPTSSDRWSTLRHEARPIGWACGGWIRPRRGACDGVREGPPHQVPRRASYARVDADFAHRSPQHTSPLFSPWSLVQSGFPSVRRRPLPRSPLVHWGFPQPRLRRPYRRSHRCNGTTSPNGESRDARGGARAQAVV